MSMGIRISDQLMKEARVKFNKNQKLDLDEQIRKEEESPQKYRFSDLVGKLEWNGDPVAEQRALRNEW